MKRNVLMLAYAFPPCGATGTFRSLGFARNLVSMGWNVTVLSASEYLKEDRDESLLVKIPPEVRVWNAPVYDPSVIWAKFKSKNKPLSPVAEQNEYSVQKEPVHNQTAGRIKYLIKTLLKIPDNFAKGWLIPALKEARKIPRPDLIYSSAPPFTSHLVGYLLKLRWNIPLVTDFRDPWTDNPFRIFSSGTVRRWDRFLEKKVFKHSNLIIANTPQMADLFRQKNPRYSAKIRVITNGFDAEDFHDILPLRDESADNLLLIHPGSLYGKRSPLNFLSALKDALEDGCARLRILLIGSCEHFENKSLPEHIHDLGLDRYVKLRPPVGRKEILSLMKGADGLLLFSQGTHIQVPAKLFEYLALGKQIIAIGENNSAANDILRQVPDNYFWAENTVDDIVRALKNFYLNADAHKDFSTGMENSPFERSKLTQRLSECFQEVFSE